MQRNMSFSFQNVVFIFKNCNQRILIPKEGKYVKFRNYERKTKSPFNQILKVS